MNKAKGDEPELANKKKNNKKGQAKKKQVKKNNAQIKKRLKIFKWFSLMALIAGASILILLSDLFNIKTIEVEGNKKITKEEIVRLSGLNIEENMFKFLKIKVEEQIKANAYIEDVQVHRKLNRNYRS